MSHASYCYATQPLKADGLPRYRISTGPLEGTNNKMKTMKRQGYGYRYEEYFKLKLCALHESKFKLIG